MTAYDGKKLVYLQTRKCGSSNDQQKRMEKKVEEKIDKKMDEISQERTNNMKKLEQRKHQRYEIQKYIKET